MRRIIAITNQKGGVGKTTTNINLAAYLAHAGRRVLAVDIDPQGNTTSGLGADKYGLRSSIYSLLLGESSLAECIIAVPQIPNLFILPANIDLSGAEIEMIEIPEREFILKRALGGIQDYDFILIDCPPSLNILTLNALCAADTVLVPIQCEYFALEGLTQLMHTIGLVQKKLNPSLLIEGVVFTMYDSRTNLSAQVVDEVKRHVSQSAYKAIIPRNVRLSEAPSHGKPISLYEPQSKGAQAYEYLANLVQEAKIEARI